MASLGNGLKRVWAAFNHPQLLARYAENERPSHIKYPSRLLLNLARLIGLLSILIPCIPVAFIARYHQWPSTAVFALNCLALVCLSALVHRSFQVIAARAGPTGGTILNATLGQSVELIIALQAFLAGKAHLVRLFIVGTTVFDLLCVLGLAFLAGGLFRREDYFHPSVAKLLLSYSTLAMMIMGTLTFDSLEDGSRALVSRAAALILLNLYAAFLYFKIKTHSFLFDEVLDIDDVSPSLLSSSASQSLHSRDSSLADDDIYSDQSVPISHATCWYLVASLLAMLLFRQLFTSHLLDGELFNSQAYIALVLLPLVSGGTKVIDAMSMAAAGGVGFAVGIAVGSAIQIFFFVAPVVVLSGWIMGINFSLIPRNFEFGSVALSIFLMSVLLRDGKSNFLKGAQCLAVYVILIWGLSIYAIFAPHENSNAL